MWLERPETMQDKQQTVQVKLTEGKVKLKELQSYLLQASRVVEEAGVKQPTSCVTVSPAKIMRATILDGRYEIQELIGTGGMGTVYEAVDSQTGRSVAIKILHADKSKDDRFTKRFQSEAALAMSLHHPNIVNILACGHDSTFGPYICMELISEDPLSHCLPLNKSSAQQVIRQICEAISYAHQHGVIHRDIKLSNILIQTEGQVKVVDFGIAKALLPDSSSHIPLTQTSDLLGTPTCMAPEQCFGEEADVRTDIYQLGCLFYELLSGRPPFPGKNSFEIMYKHVSSEPDFSSFDKRFRKILKKVMDKNPDRRYQTIALLQKDLAASSGRIFEMPELPKFAPEKAVVLIIVSVSALLALMAWQCLPKEPHFDANGWFSLAIAKGSQGDNVGAEEAFKQSLRLNPVNSGAWNGVAIAQQRQGKLADAHKSILQAIGQNENIAANWQALGLILQMQGNYTQAREAFRRGSVLPVDKKEFDSYLRKGQIEASLAQVDYLLGNYAEAEQAALKAIDLNQSKADPDAFKIWYCLSTSQEKLGKLDAAEKSIREVLSINSSLFDAWTQLGNVLSDKKDWIGAEKAFRKSTELRPQDNDYAWWWLSKALEEQGRNAESKNAMKHVAGSS